MAGTAAPDAPSIDLKLEAARRRVNDAQAALSRAVRDRRALHDEFQEALDQEHRAHQKLVDAIRERDELQAQIRDEDLHRLSGEGVRLPADVLPVSRAEASTP